LAADNGFVTSFAFHGGVRAEQREKIHVVADLLFGSEPVLRAVTLGAIRAELTQMNISMAIGAIFANIGENRLRVALGARSNFVSASKRKFRSFMAELRNATNRAPASRGVAIFTRNLHRAVWVGSCAALSKDICWK